jgi:hypothetical protein
MKLWYNAWRRWEPDGTTIRSYEAALEGPTIALRSGGEEIARILAPTSRRRWVESPEIAFAGRTLVLGAWYVNRQLINAELFEDGHSLRNGASLERARTEATTPVSEAAAFARTFVAMAPYMAVIPAIPALGENVTLQRLPLLGAAVAISFVIASYAARLGNQTLGAIQGSALRVGLRSVLVATGVFAFSTAAMIVVLAGAVRVMR